MEEDNLHNIDEYILTRKERIRNFFWNQVTLFKKDMPSLFGLIVLFIFTFVAIFAPYLTPMDPSEMYKRPNGNLAFLDPPSKTHWLGTTNVGRDVFSGLIVGTRIAMVVGVLAAILVTVLGSILGLLAGYFKGIIDDIIMRIVDVAYAMPFEPLAIVLLSFLPPSIWTIILVVSLLMWRSPTRVVRAQVLSLSKRPFVKAARIAGASNSRIIFYHIAPHILPLSFVYASSAFGWAILAEASVSFLGFGDPTALSWGKMLHYAFMSGAVRVAWWWAIPPGICITLVVASVFFISRGYEEVIIPKLKKI